MAKKTNKIDAPLSAETAERYWLISLASGVVIIGAVAALLHRLASAAEQIQAGVHQVWLSGKRIAANTVHIPLLIRTNQVAGDILEATDRVAQVADRIEKAVKPPARNN
jgi:hypothetical protein